MKLQLQIIKAAEVPEPDMSDAMMTMALAMGDWVPE